MEHDRKTAESIVFLPEDKEVVLPTNCQKSILNIAVENEIDIDHSCGGSGSCGTCLVKVLKGLELFDGREFPEKEMAEDRGWAADERLACQCVALPGVIIEVSFKNLKKV